MTIEEIRENYTEMIQWNKDKGCFCQAEADQDVLNFIISQQVKIEEQEKELDIYKPESSIQEFVELDCINNITPKQINGVFHKLHDETLELKKEIENLGEYLELAVGQQDQCPICKRWDWRELGHTSDCFMRSLPNGHIQYGEAEQRTKDGK